MTWAIVLILGAGIGVAVHLFDYTWEAVATVTRMLHIHPAKILALGGAGGAAVIGLEFWLATVVAGALN